MSKRGAWVFALSMTLSVVTAALAQPAKPVAPGAAPAPSPTAPGTPPITTEPKLPEVNDPMLELPPPPKRVLRSWQEAIARLRQDSLNLSGSRTRIQQAEAQARFALSGALPTLTGDAAVSHQLLRGERTFFDVTATPPGPATATIPDPATDFRASLNLRIPVFAPEAWYNHGTAKDGIETSRLDAKEIERQEVAIAANAIVTVVTAERLAEVSRVSLRSALSTLDLNRRRAALGASSAVDVLRAEQIVSEARANVVSADEQLLQAREELGVALGSTDDWGVTTDIRIDALASDARASCVPEQSIEARPDVRAARSSLAVAERNVKGVGYGHLPLVDAVSTLAYSEPESGINNEHVTWSIGAVLTWQIYDGGARYGTRDVRQAEASLQRDRLSDTRRRAALEVTRAVRGVRVAEANLAVSTQSRHIASETSRLSQVAFMNGSGTSFDLVDTARRLRDAEIDLAIKEFEVLRAKIAALLALATCRV